MIKSFISIRGKHFLPFNYSTNGVYFFLAPIVGSVKNAWSVCFASFGLIYTMSILLGWKVSKGYEIQDVIIKEKVTFKDLLNGPFRNKAYLHLTAAFIFSILSQAVFFRCYGVLLYL